MKKQNKALLFSIPFFNAELSHYAYDGHIDW